MAVAGGNVDKVFSIDFGSVSGSLHNRSWADMRCSSELNDAKSGKSKTLRLIQSLRACRKNSVCWRSNHACNIPHNLCGSVTVIYYNLRD